MFSTIPYLAFSDICSLSAVVGTLVGLSVHPQSTYRVEIDESFSEADITPMLEAIGEWRTISDNSIQFEISYTPCEIAPYTVCIKKVPYSTLKNTVIYDGVGSAGVTVYNAGMAGSSSILIAAGDESGFKGEQLRGIAAHELGHAMMLSHSMKGVMYYALGGAGTLSVNCDDLTQFNAIHKFPNRSFACPHGGHWENDSVHNK